ncbi:hypothetical protein JCM8208_007726 [Rhodotorula glutinis]
MAQPAAAAPAAVPFVAKVASSSFDGAYRFRLVANLELDILAPSLDVKCAFDQVPLTGKWSLAVVREDDKVVVRVRHTNKRPQVVDGVETSITLEWDDGIRRHRLATVGEAGPVRAGTGRVAPRDGDTVYAGSAVTLPVTSLDELARESGGAYDPAVQRKYRVSVELYNSGPRSSPQAVDLARRIAGSCTELSPHDVRLFFPATRNREAAELWTTEHLLTTSSAYFRDLFDSGLAESVPVGSKRARTGEAAGGGSPPGRSLAPPALDKPFEDSDDEVDRVAFQLTFSAIDEDAEPAPVSYKQVTITQAASSTYRAVLVWLQTGFIRFADLSSAFDPHASPSSSRAAAVMSAHDVDPLLPFPVSPKSVYRLAHILELDLLKAVALRHFRDECLSVKTAPIELFSELAVGYATWRDMVLEWIVERWTEVEAGTAWRDTMRRVKEDEVDGAAAILVELTTRLGQKLAQRSTA